MDDAWITHGCPLLSIENPGIFIMYTVYLFHGGNGRGVRERDRSKRYPGTLVQCSLQIRAPKTYHGESGGERGDMTNAMSISFEIVFNSTPPPSSLTKTKMDAKKRPSCSARLACTTRWFWSPWLDIKQSLLGTIATTD